VKRPPLPTASCDRCNSLREVPAANAGAFLQREREERDVDRKALAGHFGYSLAYVRDLEAGSRPLNWSLVAAYREAIEAVIRERLEKVA
jgi:transcriptional regulator with XRE-family HTH domain